MTHETATDDHGAAIEHGHACPCGHPLIKAHPPHQLARRGRALSTAGEPLWLEKANEDFLNGSAVLFEGQVVGIMTEGLLDLQGDLFEVEEEEGDATDGWGGTPAVGAYHRQRQRAQPEQEEETEGGDVCGMSGAWRGACEEDGGVGRRDAVEGCDGGMRWQGCGGDVAGRGCGGQRLERVGASHSRVASATT